MQSKGRLLMILAAICSLVMLSAMSTPSSNHPLNTLQGFRSKTILFSEKNQDSTPCMTLLMDALSKMDVAGRVIFKTENNGDLGCVVRVETTPVLKLVRTDEAVSDPCALPTEVHRPQSCTNTTFHGYYGAIFAHDHPDNTVVDFNEWEYIWIMPKGGHNYIMSVDSMYEEKGPDWAEALWSVAENGLPLSEGSVNDTEQPTLPMVPVTTVPGEVPGGDVPTTVPAAPTDTGGLFGIPAAVILGSLGVPVAGAIAGAALSALLSGLSSGGVSTGNLLKTVVHTPQPTATASAIPEDSLATVKPVPQVPPQPPPVQTSPAPISTDPPPVETATSPAAPVEASIDPFKAGFNLVKDTVSAVGNISGVFNKYFAGPDTAETVGLIRNAVNTWHDAPSVHSATNYLENLGKSNALREPAISKTLGIVGKGLDVVEAGMNASKICAERGYSGLDAILTTYAKVGEKAVVWGLTKNPVVALADTAVGGATTLIFGAQNKVDIGVVVDKTDYAWDNVTRHAADRYYRGIEKAAESEKAENLQYITERIRQQVMNGQLNKQEGTRRLQKVLDKFNQESPLL